MYTEVIIRADARHMRDDRREELIAWIKSLGVDPNNVRQALVIVQAEQEYELHLTAYRRSPEGRIRIDRATEDAVTEPLVVPLGPVKNWPGWLNGPCWPKAPQAEEVTINYVAAGSDVSGELLRRSAMRRTGSDS